MAQERYLSPREILSYLCDLESKMPKRYYWSYVTQHNPDLANNPTINLIELNSEGQRMLDFAGMNDFKAEVTFCRLDDNTGGNTIPGHTPNGIIHINISNNFKNNWKAALAVVAHELCHHIIYRYGIRPKNMDWLVETYTDLCTIYVGFGEIILDGYKTDVNGVKHTLGYLDWNTYKVTNHIVGVICGGEQSNKTGLKGSDFLADDSIEVWESTKDKNHLFKDAYKKCTETIAGIRRDTEFLKQIITIYNEESTKRIEELNNLFFSKGYENIDFEKQPLAIFRCLYESMVFNQNSQNAYMESYRYAIGDAIYLLYSVLNEHKSIFFENKFECPVCKKQYRLRNQDEKYERLKLIKCGQCNTIFTVNTDQWNATAWQRDYLIRLNKRNNDYFEKYKCRIEEIANKEIEITRKTLHDKNVELEKKEKNILLFEKSLIQKKEEIINDYFRNMPSWLFKVINFIVNFSSLSKLGKNEKRTKKALIVFRHKKFDKNTWLSTIKAFSVNLDDLYDIIIKKQKINNKTIKRLVDFAYIIIDSNYPDGDFMNDIQLINNNRNNETCEYHVLTLMRKMDKYFKEKWICFLTQIYTDNNIEMFVKKGCNQEEKESYVNSLIVENNGIIKKILSETNYRY